MATAKYINTFSNDFGTRLSDLKRRQKYAELLAQQGAEPIDVESVGGVPTPISPFQGLAKLLKSGMGGYLAGKASEDEAALEKDENADFRSALNSVYTKTDTLPGMGDSLPQEMPTTPAERVRAASELGGSSNRRVQEIFPTLLSQANKDLTAATDRAEDRADKGEELLSDKERIAAGLLPGNWVRNAFGGYERVAEVDYNSPEAQRQALEKAAAGRSLAPKATRIVVGANGEVITGFNDGRYEVARNPDGSIIYSAAYDPQRTADINAGRAEGKARGAIIAALPQTTAGFNDTMNLFTAIKNIPDNEIKRAFGPIDKRLPDIGGVNTNIRARLGQLKGKAFLNAFSSLRGGGTISNVEGDKATAAQFRINEAGTVPEMRAAMADAEALMRATYNATLQQAGNRSVDPSARPLPPIPEGYR
jgi:hypothetical protein